MPTAGGRDPARSSPLRVSHVASCRQLALDETADFAIIAPAQRAAEAGAMRRSRASHPGAKEIAMADNNSSDVILTMMTKNLDQARGAMTNYLEFIGKSMSVTPLGTSSQANALKGYIDRNVQATFDFSQQLLHAKDFQDVVRIQTEFLQTQFRVLTDQAKDVVEMTRPTVIIPRDG
jgi:hypothetical protein